MNPADERRAQRAAETLLSRVGNRVLELLPTRLQILLRRRSRYFCPVCEQPVQRFLGFAGVSEECCPHCASMRRHRLLWLFITRRTNLFDGTRRRVLHIAPEPALEARLNRTPELDYVSADLYAPRVMDRQDITRMTYSDQSFDVILCSHVLEHVPRDRPAMRELARVLRPGGWAAIMVPYSAAEPTDEDPLVTDPVEREHRFGRADHVRSYGVDLPDRLSESGFSVQLVTAAAFIPAEDLERYQVDEGETIFVCRAE